MATQGHILSKARRAGFDRPPNLNTHRNKGYVAIDAESRAHIRSMEGATNKIGFMLQKAYFHAKGRFFKPDQFTRTDIKLVASLMGARASFKASDYAYSTMNAHQNKILEMFGWSRFEKSHELGVRTYATETAQYFKSKEDVFFKLVEWCWANRVTIPRYNKLADIVNEAFVDFETRIQYYFDERTNDFQRQRLLSIRDDDLTAENFSKLRKIDQSTSTSSLNQNFEYLSFFKSHFEHCEPLLETLDLNHETVKYFSELVTNSTYSQLKRLKSESKVGLMMLSFVVDQFCLRQDYSIDAFKKELTKIWRKSVAHERKAQNERRRDLVEQEALIIGSATNAASTMRLILNVSENTNVSLAERNEKVIQLARQFLEGEPDDLLDAISRLEDDLENIATRRDRYQFLFECGRSLTLKFGSYLSLWNFDRERSDPKILTAVDYLNSNADFKPDELPTDLFSASEKSIVLKVDNIPIITKYRSLVMLKLAGAIHGKRVNFLHSYRFRMPDTYYIPTTKWNRDRESLCAAAGIKYLDGNAALKDLGRSSADLFEAVAKSIHSKENNFVQVRSDGSWYHAGYKADYSTEKYIPTLLANSKQITLFDVIREVNRYANFTDSFQHFRASGGKQQAEADTLYAALYSLGTNVGHLEVQKMTGRYFTEKQLRDTETAFFSASSLKKVNRCLVEFIHSLNLPAVYIDDGSVIHTSSDGKKLVVDVDSLLANYSFKYYGKESGINVNNFLDPKQISFNVNVLPSSDREAPYMMSGLIESSVELEEDYGYDDIPGFHADSPDTEKFEHLHSADSHGYTEAIFAALWFKNIQLQPYIAKLWKHKFVAYDKATCARYQDEVIRPSRAIVKKTILSQWDEMLRIMCSVSLGYCPPHLAFRQLSAGAAHFPVYRAFQELGRLVRTKNTLRFLYMDELRSDIRKYLNRVELGQKFGSAIFHGRQSKLQVGGHDGIHKAMLCKTILMNTLIAWNYLFLSDHYRRLKTREEKETAISKMRTGSVLSHGHVNMGGTLSVDRAAPRSFSGSLDELRNIELFYPPA